MTERGGNEAERLAVLLGHWHTRGRTTASGEAPLEIDATDTYEWLPARSGLLHTVDARMGEAKVEGAEIIGWDPSREKYRSQYFGSDGPNAYEAELSEEDGVLKWTMRSATDRFTGRFSDDRDRISGFWERRAEGETWEPWMEITLTKGAEEGS